MRLAVTSLGAALALVVATACSSAPATLVVGEFNPFSGPDAVFGPEMVGGCIPAIRLINADGGVLGHHLSCVQEDTRGDPADAVPAARKMMATETSLIGVLGPSSDESLPPTMSRVTRSRCGPIRQATPGPPRCSATMRAPSPTSRR